MSKTLRKKRIKISLTDDEYSALLDRADGKPLAAYMREFCLSAEIPKRRKPPKKVDPELMRKFAGFCNNLNQIARKLNSRQLMIRKSTDEKDTAYQLMKLRESVDQLLKDHLHASDVL